MESRPVTFRNPGSFDHYCTEWDLEWFAGLSRLSKPVDLIYMPDADHVLVKPWKRMTSQQDLLDSDRPCFCPIPEVSGFSEAWLDPLGLTICCAQEFRCDTQHTLLEHRVSWTEIGKS